MERSSLETEQVVDGDDFDLNEWAVGARRITKQNSCNISRRFSASNLQQPSSFTSNVTVSSTASSPGYTNTNTTTTTTSREEIDPSTYSFTTALRALQLQAQTVYTWELQARDGLILHSKWNEAERYISNPLSGQVPLECLSAKTLSGRSFRGLTTRITMSAPLIYPSHIHHFHPINHVIKSNGEEKKGTTRDVGTQSTPVDLSSSSPTPAPTPSIHERSISTTQAGDSSASFKSVETNEAGERESRERNGGERKQQMMGCLPLRGLWMRTQRQSLRQREKHKTNNNCSLSTFLHHFNGCTSKQSNFLTK